MAANTMTAEIKFRVEPGLKRKAEEKAKSLGFTSLSAINRVLLERFIEEDSFILMPSKQLIGAINEANEGKTTTYKDR